MKILKVTFVKAKDKFFKRKKKKKMIMIVHQWQFVLQKNYCFVQGDTLTIERENYLKDV